MVEPAPEQQTPLDAPPDAALGDAPRPEGELLPQLPPPPAALVPAAEDELSQLDKLTKHLRHKRAEVEHDREVEALRNQKNLTVMRVQFAKRMFWLLVFETVVIYAFVLSVGLGKLKLSDLLIGSIANATIIQVAVLVGIILKYLFPSDKDVKLEPLVADKSEKAEKGDKTEKTDEKKKD